MQKLKLKDAYTRIDQASKQEETLRLAFNKWVESGGVQAGCEKDPEYTYYQWLIVVNEEPTEHLGLLAGEICHNLRAALDYVAFAIFLAGGGDRSSGQAKSVQFPIVRDYAGWNKAVAANVPFAWDDAIERLKWCQPFVQLPPNNTALPVLQGVGATDKHRELLPYAAGLPGIEGYAPELNGDETFAIVMTRPGPVLDELNRPGLLGYVCVTRQKGKPTDENLFKWSEKDLPQPPPPPINFGFRANDGANIEVNAIRDLIAHVRQIVDRFKELPVPKKSPPPTTPSSS